MNLEQPPHKGASPVDDEDDRSDELLQLSLAKKKGKIWPSVKKLCTNDMHKSILWKMLRQVDECRCTSELAATNADNPKGNCWSRLFDNFFGGGTPGRGLLANQFPKLQNSSKLKTRIEEIWKYLKANQDNPTIDRQTIQVALRQRKEYENTKAKEASARDTQKKADAETFEKMKVFEGGVGALPPGAKGVVGGGCLQLSTNLKTNQPAGYFYSNCTTDESAINHPSMVDDAIIVDEDLTPPKPKPRPRPRALPQPTVASLRS